MNIYELCIQYLKENVPSLNDEQNWNQFEKLYFAKPNYSCLENVFFEIPNSMYSQRRGMYIKYSVNESAILTILHGDSVQKTCEYQYVSKTYGKDFMKLVEDLQKAIGFQILNDNPNRNSWVIFAKSICDSALFLSKYTSYDDLVAYCVKDNPADRFDIAKKIARQRGAGCSSVIMTLNWLKDIGIEGYCKPDIHLCRIITGIFKDEFLEKGKPYTSTCMSEWEEKLPGKTKVQKDVFIKAVHQAVHDNADLFAVDRILFLIGSGDFYEPGVLSSKLKEEYASNVHGIDKDKRFVDFVLSHK